MTDKETPSQMPDALDALKEIEGCISEIIEAAHRNGVTSLAKWKFSDQIKTIRADIAETRATSVPSEPYKMPTAYKYVPTFTSDNTATKSNPFFVPSDLEAEQGDVAYRGLCEIREIYCNMEGFIPQTAPEGYVLQEIKRMYDTAVEHIALCKHPHPPAVAGDRAEALKVFSGCFDPHDDWIAGCGILIKPHIETIKRALTAPDQSEVIDKLVEEATKIKRAKKYNAELDGLKTEEKIAYNRGCYDTAVKLLALAEKGSGE